MKITELFIRPLCAQLLIENFNTVKQRFLDAGIDSVQIDQYFDRFRKLSNQQRLTGAEKDINYWGKLPFAQFVSHIEQKESEVTKTTKIKQQRSDVGERVDLTAELGLADKGWNIYIPLDKSAACYKTDKGTDWCVAKRNHNYFEQYVYDYDNDYDYPRLLVYCLRDSDKKFWAILLTFDAGGIHYGSEEFYSRIDNRVSAEYFRKSTRLNFDKIESLVEQKLPQVAPRIQQLKKTSIPYLVSKIKKPSLELEKRILDQGNQEDVLDYYINTGKLIPGSQKFYLTNANSVSDFWLNFLQNRGLHWSSPQAIKKLNITPEQLQRADELLSTNINLGFAYSKSNEVRWPKTEQAIAKSDLAVDYARAVIQGRFPAAEPYIAKKADLSHQYAAEVLESRFPPGEAAIATKGNLAYSYARYRLKTLWSDPALNIDLQIVAHAERSIKKDGYLKAYQKLPTMSKKLKTVKKKSV